MTDAKADRDAAPADWQRAMDAATEDDGYLTPLGDRHWAYFLERKPTLLVTFDSADAIRAQDDTMPLHHAMTRSRDWSHLCVICEGETWWRDPAVFRYFDRLVDDGFLDDFDHVVFYGAGIAGYAAAAYSAVAPGAQVVLVAPCATMDPARAGWDDRHRSARRVDFTDRYTYAPDMTEGAGQVWLIYDPHNPLDAMHAALFHRPWTTCLLTRHVGEGTEDTLIEMRILDRILEAAAQNALTRDRFARLWRGRRSNASYLRALLAEAKASGHTRREIKICRSVTSRLRAPRFERRLAELTGVKT